MNMNIHDIGTVKNIPVIIKPIMNIHDIGTVKNIPVINKPISYCSEMFCRLNRASVREA